MDDIAIGSIWHVKPSPGDTWTTDSTVRVMTVIEGYVVYRFAGEMPMLAAKDRFLSNYVPAIGA